MARIIIAVVALALGFAAEGIAQPRLSNGEVRTTPLGGALSRAVIEKTAGTGPAWVGYAVPIVAGDHQMCCWNSDSGGCCSGCRLENRSGAGPFVTAPPTGPIKLEGSTQLFVLYRIENGAVNKIRMFSEDCALDGGGLVLHWLTGVRAPDSVALLGTLAADTSSRSIVDGALSALAMHADPSALERLIAAARQASSTHVRGQALFWLAQRAGDKAIGVISDAIEKDPETDVKRRAVFALSQLPKDEGVPRLIQLARTNGNPAVRKQAMFWLGQSRDPRAIDFFADILK